MHFPALHLEYIFLERVKCERRADCRSTAAVSYMHVLSHKLCEKARIRPRDTSSWLKWNHCTLP
jgi:hypothetical protein